LEEIAFKLIKNFGDKCGKPPQRIMFFRDGVAESQFDQVCREEIGAIKSALGKLKKGYSPPITYIICGKRHHIRKSPDVSHIKIKGSPNVDNSSGMYPQNPNDADRSGNVKAGTVVDREITHPFYADFYLMSHAGLLGTSRPTHYTVLLDESNLGPDQIQATAYYLAHIYARSTRSVSIASPAYYAHHVCFRARHHIGDDDGAASDMGSASPEQLDALRDQKLQFARSQLARGLGDNIVSHNIAVPL
jgi:eukaryotic translation initiation factor 2C